VYTELPKNGCVRHSLFSLGTTYRHHSNECIPPSVPNNINIVAARIFEVEATLTPLSVA
jgi:hypothetical protein